MMFPDLLAAITLGESLTLWSIRISLIFYVACVSIMLYKWPSPFSRIARTFWTIACIVYIIHVLFAFQFYHDWSHINAYEHTAAKTLQTVGWNWGGGIYFNYFFTLLWARDVLLWWLQPTEYPKRSLCIHRFTHGFIAFIAFNASVVFASGPIRWLGASVTIWLMLLIIRIHFHQKSIQADPGQGQGAEE